MALDGSSARPKTVAMILLVIATVLGILAGGWSVFGDMRTVRALVPEDGWSMSGAFSAEAAMSNAQQIPSELWSDPSFRYWQAWTADGSPAIGQIESAPFKSPSFVAIPYGGFPDEVPGNRIVLRCEASTAEIAVSRFRMNDLRATSYLYVPGSFCSGDIRLVASIDKKGFLAVGTPFEISAARYYAETGMFSRALVVVLTWLCLMLAWFKSTFLCTRISSSCNRVAAGLVGIAILGMVFIVTFTIGPSFGRASVLALTAMVILGSAVVAFRARDWTRDTLRDLALPSAVWLAVALFYASVVTAADNGGGSWWINSLFTPVRWSSDNQIPYQFAEALLEGRAPADIRWGPWLPTDRTPLLTGLLLPVRVLILGPLANVIGPTFRPTAYMMSSIVMLSIWAAVLVAVLRRFSRHLFSIPMILAVTTPFLLFNSVFAWPKMLGAAYVLLSFGLLFEMRSRSSDRVMLVLIALAASAAFLSHSSNVFALLPVALLFLPTIFRQGPRRLAIATLAAIALALPWFYWQWALVPGGNALLRFALAFDFDAGNRDRSVLSAMRDVYSSMSLTDWLNNKIATIGNILGFTPMDFGLPEMASNSAGAGPLGNARILDFLSVRHALGIAGLGILLVPFLGHFGKNAEAVSLARLASVAGVAGVVLALLVTLPPGIVHHQAYGALLLIVLGGGLAIALAPRWLGWASALISLAYFAVVWVWHPIATAVTIHFSAIYLMGLCVAWIALMLWKRPPEAGASVS